MAKITFKKVQEIFEAKEASIEKEGRASHYFINGDSNHVYLPKTRLDELVALLEELGTEKFIDTYKVRTAEEKEQMKSDAHEKKVQVKKTKKDAKGKVSKKETLAMEAELEGWTLKLMALDFKDRHSEEHYAIRKELHSVYAKLVAVGLRRDLTRTA